MVENLITQQKNFTVKIYINMGNENTPIYLITGTERRKKKKELGELKRFVKTFWYHEDICRTYGGGLDDVTCNKILAKSEQSIADLELMLKTLKYKS